MVVYEFGPFRLDAERLLLFLDGAPIALGPKVVETLLPLVEQPGQVVTKRALLERVWPEGYVDEANLSQNVYVLRKLLRARGCERAIETLTRRGYRFTLPVRRLEGEWPSAAGRQALYRVAAVALVVLLAIAGGGGYAYGTSRAHHARAMTAEERLFTLGNIFLSLRTRSGMERSIIFFTRAIAVKPAAARDYAARASTYVLMSDYGYAGLKQRTRLLARQDALHALSLDPRCGEAQAALGLIALDAHREGEALQRLQTAITLVPNDASAHEWYGIALLERGRIVEASQQLHMAQRLDPLSIATTSWLASVAYLQRRYQEAITYARQGLAVAPGRHVFWMTLGLAQEQEGRYGEAVESFWNYANSCSSCAGEGAALLAFAYVRLHELRAAHLELALASRPGATPRPEDLALALAAAGERAPSLSRLAHRMTGEDRAVVANDPRFGALPNTELHLLEDD